MGLDLIIRCENENLDWGVMALDTDEIEEATPRDSEADASHTVSQLRMKIIGDRAMLSLPEKNTTKNDAHVPLGAPAYRNPHPYLHAVPADRARRPADLRQVQAPDSPGPGDPASFRI